jgi:hypothetical protein
MNELMDSRKYVKVKCDWESNIDKMDINDCVVVRLLPPEHETLEL